MNLLILEDLLLATRIDVFSHRAKRKLTSHQKFYFFDAGVYRILRPTGPLDAPEEIDGAALETLFYQSVKALNDYFNWGYKIFFWRTYANEEVDFVLYGPKGLHAFEIKRSSHVSQKFLKGLKAFSLDYPEAQLHFLYLGNLTEYHDRIVAAPFEQVLRNLPQLLGRV